MTQEEYRRFRKKVQLYLNRVWPHGDVDDIMQDVMLKWQEHRGEVHQTVEQAVIDVLRKTGPVKKSGRKNEDLTHQELREVIPDRALPFAERLIVKTEVEKLLRPMHGIDKALLMLKYFWGFTQREIAQCFGVTEARISQRITTLEKDLLAKDGD